MSLVFSNTTTKNGLIQLCERNLGFSDGYISNDSTLLAQFTGDINLALDRAVSIILGVGGTWQFDDSNHSDYPIITTNIVANQRDYSFTVDGNSNLILEVFKVFVADSTGLFTEILPVDVQTSAPTNYTSGQNTTGIPNSYDKTGSGIFLDPVPNYNRTGGLKIYINREASYFTTSDTTKKPGFAGIFHEYLAFRASYQFAQRKSMSNSKALGDQMMLLENDIREYYKAREKDVQKVLIPSINNPR